MNSTKYTGMISGMFLILFTLVFGSLLLFGFYGPAATKSSQALFKTLYFVLMMIILGIVYLMNMDKLTSITEHVLIIGSIFIFSVSVSLAAGGLKTMQDSDLSTGALSVAELSAQNDYYAQYVEVLNNRSAAIKHDNAQLLENIDVLSQKINNKTPIVVETIVTLPPEIIYVEEATSVAPVVRNDDDDEESEEDDD